MSNTELRNTGSRRGIIESESSSSQPEPFLIITPRKYLERVQVSTMYVIIIRESFPHTGTLLRKCGNS